MIIACDFDATIVHQDRRFGDLEPDLHFIDGAKEALESLKRAGHTLILYSGRANRANRLDWRLNPGYVSGAIPFDEKAWEKARPMHEELYREMLDFVAKELDGVFAYIDDGMQGKPSCDLFIDDKNLQFHGNWEDIQFQYGDD